MAVDTKAKRYSILNFPTMPLGILINPAGTVSANDRAHFLGLYSGISLDNPAGTTLLNYMRGMGRGFNVGMGRGFY